MKHQKYATGCHPLAEFELALQPGELQGYDGPADGPSLQDTMNFVKFLRFCCHRGSGTDSDSVVRTARLRYLYQLLEGSSTNVGESHWRPPPCPAPDFEVMSYTSNLVSRCFARKQRLAETECGYIGLFPVNVRPGDLLCALNELSQMVVLRKKGDHYLFVGTCYVFGLTSGNQVADCMHRQGKEVETIKIR